MLRSMISTLLEQWFQLSHHGTSVRTEITAGVTTFMAMAYITVVNPSILSQTGMDFGAVFVATCLAAALGSLVMGLAANYPIAQAPGMSQNAFFAYGIVLGMGMPWQTALGAVFVSGIIFIALSVLPIREWLINSIPRNLKLGISAGIGLFLAFIAMQNAGIVVAHQATLVSFGDVTSFAPAAALVGFFLIVALMSRGVSGAVIIGILTLSAAGWLSGQAEFMGVASAPPSMAPVLMALDIASVLDVALISVVLTLLLVDVFDTAGTLVGVATRGNFIGADGRLPRLRSALLADSSATAVGALLGTSSTTSYIESAAGVESGGRTGLTAVVVAALFLLCLVFAPLAQSIPSYACASALLFVAASMVHSLVDIDWDDLTEYAPAALTAIAMPLSFSIADGIGVGFISYVAIKLLTGRFDETPAAVSLVAAVFLGKFLFL